MPSDAAPDLLELRGPRSRVVSGLLDGGGRLGELAPGGGEFLLASEEVSGGLLSTLIEVGDPGERRLVLGGCGRELLLELSRLRPLLLELLFESGARCERRLCAALRRGASLRLCPSQLLGLCGLLLRGGDPRLGLVGALLGLLGCRQRRCGLCERCGRLALGVARFLGGVLRTGREALRLALRVVGAPVSVLARGGFVLVPRDRLGQLRVARTDSGARLGQRRLVRGELLPGGRELAGRCGRPLLELRHALGARCGVGGLLPQVLQIAIEGSRPVFSGVCASGRSLEGNVLLGALLA